MPPEVLRHILLFNDEDTSYPQPESCKYAPHEVCSAWRHVALSSAELWLNIRFHFSNLGRYGDTSGFLQFLQRSRDHLLRVSIKFEGQTLGPVSGALVGIILAHAHQWGTISLKGCNASIRLVVKALPFAVRLEGLELQADVNFD